MTRSRASTSQGDGKHRPMTLVNRGDRWQVRHSSVGDVIDAVRGGHDH